jgi:excisionase family DNA binding protein
METLAYTTKEACIALRCGRGTLYRLINSGRLRALAFGARTLIPRADVERLFDELPPAKQRGRMVPKG